MISLRLIQDQKVKTLNNSHVVTAGLEIFFLKPWDKMSDGILLTVGHNQSLFVSFLTSKEFSYGFTI